ncbi:TPA: fimbrial protein [Serratia marcescens]
MGTWGVLFLSGAGWAAPEAMQGVPVPVTFGVRALAPETPVDPQRAFLSQPVTLPVAACTPCSEQDNWRRTWAVSHRTLDTASSRTTEGWYVFHSGLAGIGIGVQVSTPSVSAGRGPQAADEGTVTVGLVRLARETGAGLAALPPTEFVRTTTFAAPDGTVRQVQEDTLRVSADLRVPTCTSSAGGLAFVLPDVRLGQLRQAGAGMAIGTVASVPQRVVANCSANTHRVRIRFIPSGSVSDSDAGPATLLVGKDALGQETGVGFLMRYDGQAFGRAVLGVVSWDPSRPLVLSNPTPAGDGGALSEGISVTLQAFYARVANGKGLVPGNVTARGIYQVSYD